MPDTTFADPRLRECLELVRELGAASPLKVDDDPLAGLRAQLQGLAEQRRTSSLDQRRGVSPAMVHQALIDNCTRTAKELAKELANGSDDEAGRARARARSKALANALDDVSDIGISPPIAGVHARPRPLNLSSLLKELNDLFAASPPHRAVQAVFRAVAGTPDTVEMAHRRRFRQLMQLATGCILAEGAGRSLLGEVGVATDTIGSSALFVRISADSRGVSGASRSPITVDGSAREAVAELAESLGIDLKFDERDDILLSLSCTIQLTGVRSTSMADASVQLSSSAREQAFSRASDSMTAPIVPERSNQVRALIVEDNPINARVLSALLRGLGMDCEVANDGRTGVEQVRRAEFDVVLMDCEMPIMDGFEATKAIRAFSAPWAKIPIIAVTSHASAEDRHRCADAGMDDYVSKPIRKDLLIDALARHVPGFFASDGAPRAAGAG